MDERPKKRRGLIGWLAARTRRLWIVIALLMPVLYVASFGPAAWLVARGYNRHRLPPIYRPLGELAKLWPRLHGLLRAYAQVNMPETTMIYLPEVIDRGDYRGIYIESLPRDHSHEQPRD